MTVLGKNTVKEIDLQRLKGKYTVDGKIIIKPKEQVHFLGVDKFKLHNGKYASLIIDMEAGLSCGFLMESVSVPSMTLLIM